MTALNEAELKAIVLRVLSGIAPEVDVAAIDPGHDLRDQLDIDSVDFLNFVIGLHTQLGVDVPEVDAPKLATLDGCVAYLFSKLNGP